MMYTYHLFVLYSTGGDSFAMHRTCALPFPPFWGLLIETEEWSFDLPSADKTRIHYDMDREEFIIEDRTDVYTWKYDTFREEIARMLEEGWEIWRVYELKRILRRIKELNQEKK